MALTNWSKTAANNATVGSIDYAENMAPNKINDSARQQMADVASHMENIPHYYEAGGTANALTITTSWPLTAYADGQQFTVKAALANTGAVTLNVDGVGAANVIKLDGNDHASGDIAVGDIFDVVRVGSSWQRKTPLSADATFLSDAQANAAIAATKATEATTDAATAATKASEATASAATASTQATNATNSATTAATQASSAATSATSASTSASTAATQAANATNSATTAATKESEATTNATLANTARVSAQSDATIANAERVAMQAANAGVLNSYFGKDLAFTANLAADPDFITGFVYDARNDPDGGLAWARLGRPHTSHVAIYKYKVEFRNMLDAAFPVYLNFVGDAPGLVNGPYVYAGGNRYVSCGAVLSGKLVLGTLNTSGTGVGMILIDTVVGEAFNYNLTNITKHAQPFSGRNLSETGKGYATTISSGGVSVGGDINFAAMTTLLNAPADEHGRLVPTIVLPTNTGINVIRDDGTIVNITASTGNVWTHVDVSETGKIVAFHESLKEFWVFDIPTSNIVLSNGVNGTRYDEASTPAIFTTNDSTGLVALKAKWLSSTKIIITRSELTIGAQGFVILDTEAQTTQFVTKDYATPPMTANTIAAIMMGTATGALTNGATIEDHSVNGNDAQVIGTLTQTAGALSGFNASNYAQIPYDASVPDGVEALSIKAWVYFDSLVNGAIVDFGENAAGKRRLFYTNGTDNSLAWNNASGQVSIPNVLITGVWQRVGVTQAASGDVTMYVNGRAVGSGTITQTAQTISEPVRVGSGRGLATFVSSLKYVELIDAELSADEMLADYDATKNWLQTNAKTTIQGTSNQVNDVVAWKGFVAAGTDDGADVFDTKTGLWVKRYDTTNTSLTDNQIKTLTASADGALVLSDSTKAQRIDKPEIKLDEKQLFLKLYPLVARLLSNSDGTLQLSAPEGLANDLGPQKAFRSTGITDNATSEKVTVTDNGLVVAGTVAQASGPIASRPSATLAGPGGEYISTDEGSPRPIYKSDGVVWRQITLT